MSSIVHVCEWEVMFLSQSLLEKLIRALKAERLFVVIQVCSVGAAQNTFEQSSRVQPNLQFKLHFYSLF